MNGPKLSSSAVTVPGSAISIAMFENFTPATAFPVFGSNAAICNVYVAPITTFCGIDVFIGAATVALSLS